MKTAYINGIILDGTKDMKPEEGKIILVDDGKISSIDTAENIDTAGYEIVDLNGKYILPGLINLHVHLPGSGKPTKKPMNLPLICKIITSCSLGDKIGIGMEAKGARNALLGGITTIRTVGGVSNYDTKVRDGINKGKLIGPRILASNLAISVEGGHMAGTFAHIANSADEARVLVDVIAEDKPDLIKLMVTGGIMDGDSVGEPGVLRMPEEYIKAACDRAHELGYKVAAHCEGPEGVIAALRNGVDTIEHGAKPSDEIMALYKEREACQVLTLSPALPYVNRLKGLFNLSEVAVTNSKIVVDGMVEMAKRCLEEGITVGLGTDSSCTYVTQYGMWRELKYFTEYCGVSNSFAIHTATLVNAEIAGVDDITGSIERGKYADMIAVEKNPLEDISALRSPAEVIFKGERFINPVPKLIPEVEEALDEMDRL